MSEELKYNNVADMFKDKNFKIFSENISRNITDNDSSLRLTVSNRVSLVSTEILRKINDLFKQSGTKYDFKTLNDLFSKYSLSLTDYSFALLDERKNEILSAFLADTSTISGIVAVLDQFLVNKKESFERGINEIIYSQLEGELVERFKFSDEVQQQQVFSYLCRFDSKVTNAVETSIIERDSSLKITVQGTYEKVEKLNSLTSDYSVWKK